MKLFVTILIILLLCLIILPIWYKLAFEPFYNYLEKGKMYAVSNDYIVDEPIDIVYTWVDGNNEDWLAEKAKYMPSQKRTDNKKKRYRNNNEIMYSLRSVEKFAPWIRNVFIVTYNENSYPSFLNVNHPKVKIIPHSAIFSNKNHLPTYNSHAIEANIGKIPGLSKRFLYANDDMMFGSKVTKNDFIAEDGRMLLGTRGISKVKKIFFNTAASAHGHAWVNLRNLIGRDYGIKLLEYSMSHHIQIIDKDILNSVYPTEIMKTSSHRFRSGEDIPPIGAAITVSIKTNRSFYIKRSELVIHSIFLKYINFFPKKNVKFICVNDDSILKVGFNTYKRFYNKYVHEKSSFEK
jgi:hypothetical protein